MTYRTFFIDNHIHNRTYTLARNLHKTKLTQREYVVLRTIFLHILTHPLIEQLTVFCKMHIDKIDHDNTSHITQTQLPRQLIGSTQINLERVLLLCAGFHAMTAVDVNHMQSFCVFNDKVCAALV